MLFADSRSARMFIISIISFAHEKDCYNILTAEIGHLGGSVPPYLDVQVGPQGFSAYRLSLQNVEFHGGKAPVFYLLFACFVQVLWGRAHFTGVVWVGER